MDVVSSRHSLKEIRVRALKSILSKLDHSLLSVADLLQERALFLLLLEWFNFPEHPSAAQMLRDVGAVEFLTQLSPNVEPRLRAVIDGTLDQLFQLPEILPSYTPVPPPPPPPPPMDTLLPVHQFSTEQQSQLGTGPLVNFCVTSIMQDFPAEIFCNRPSIVQGSASTLELSAQDPLVCNREEEEVAAYIGGGVEGGEGNLLGLLRLSSGEGEAAHLGQQALGCLQQLCVALRTRLRFHQDPGFSSAKQAAPLDVRGTQPVPKPPSSGTECSPRPSVLGRTCQRARGDGQDGDAVSNRGGGGGGSGGGGGGVSAAAAAAQVSGQAAQSPADGVAPLDLPVLGVEDTLEMQLQQLSLAQFSVAAMERAIPLLKTDEPMHSSE
ncbi:hypothetical protein CRUP_032122 [Coryphaenoides rupestris]|nr:hypothetical protein CRUP_032122 [Coryphaenoides rupestris]